MPPPPSGPVSPGAIVRSSSEAQGREKDLPLAPVQVARTSSEPPIYLSMRGPPDFGDPRTRSEQREVARRRAEAEERATQREEAARQAQIKAQRAAEAQQAEQEVQERRARVERDLARKATARLAREEEERLEEERRVREREERLRRGAEKRAEAARKFEEWRIEEERKREELARAEEELKRMANERREAARLAAAKRRRESHWPGDSVLLNGWVTVQHPPSVAWRRRYFQLTDTVMRLYKQEKVSGLYCSFEEWVSLTGYCNIGHWWCPIGRHRTQELRTEHQRMVRRVRGITLYPSSFRAVFRQWRASNHDVLRHCARKGTLLLFPSIVSIANLYWS
jgi:flagellar biosynthesis GTPase FlhF